MFQRSVLDNQLRVLTSAIAHTNSVSMVICVGSGSRYETPEMAGVSHFIEHLPFKGTKKWPTAREVSEAIEGVGGIMNAKKPSGAAVAAASPLSAIARMTLPQRALPASP